MQEKLKFLSKKDPILGQFIEVIGPLEVTKREDHYRALVSSIIGQMLSAKVAATIFGRFVELTKGDITPLATLSLSDEELRSIGISSSKIKYIKDLAQKVQDKEMDLNSLEELSNEEVVAALTSVKGIGKWTAEMFLIFSLGREDVLSVLDVGLQRGAKWLYNAKDGKTILEKKAAKWMPYQSIASLYLWEAVNRDYVTSYKSFKDFLQK